MVVNRCKVTRGKKLRFFYIPVLVVLGSIVFFTSLFSLIGFQFFDFDFILITQIIAISAIFLLLPHVIIYLNYLRINGRVILSISENKIQFEDGSSKIEILIKEIQGIDKVMGYKKYHDKGVIIPWQEYFYYKVYCPGGPFIISCLICDNLENYINNVPFHKRMSHGIKLIFPKT